MPHIEPYRLKDDEDAQLSKVRETCKRLQVPDDFFLGILRYVPGYEKALTDAMLESHVKGNVDHKLKENHLEIQLNFSRQLMKPNLKQN